MSRQLVGTISICLVQRFIVSELASMLMQVGISGLQKISSVSIYSDLFLHVSRVTIACIICEVSQHMKPSQIRFGITFAVGLASFLASCQGLTPSSISSYRKRIVSIS